MPYATVRLDLVSETKDVMLNLWVGGTPEQSGVFVTSADEARVFTSASEAETAREEAIESLKEQMQQIQKVTRGLRF